VLPGPKCAPAAANIKAEYLTDFTQADLNPNAKGGHRGDEEEEEGYGNHRHQQRAECGVQ
jgi:hypothetical protein